jgi:hypothetical protein
MYNVHLTEHNAHVAEQLALQGFNAATEELKSMLDRPSVSVAA